MPARTGGEFFTPRSGGPTLVAQFSGLHEPYWTNERYDSGPDAGRRKPAEMMVPQLQSLRRLGFDGVRIDTSWAALQPKPGPIDWKTGQGYQLRHVLQLIADNELGAVLTVSQSPAWARPNTDPAKLNQFPDADHLGAASEFAQLLTKDLDPGTVRGIEVWNEPNLKAFAGLADRPTRARAYPAVLDAFYDGIKRARPDMPVMLGGSSLIDVPSVTAWLAQRPRFDVFSVHPYMVPQNAPVTATPAPGQDSGDFITSYPKLQRLLPPGTPQAWGEVGFTVAANSGGQPQQHEAVATSADAISQVVGTYDLANQYGVGLVNFFTAYATQPEFNGMSLLKQDGAPYPHAVALAEHVREVRRAASVPAQTPSQRPTVVPPTPQLTTAWPSR